MHHLDVPGPVGVGVAADRERQPVGGRAQERAHLRRLGEQVDAGVAGAGLRGGQRAGACASGGDHPVPDPGLGDVDGHDVGAPLRQRLQRPHLGAGTEQCEGPVGQVEPAGLVEHPVQRGAAGRLDGPPLHPGVELAAQRITGQRLPAVGQDQLADPLPLAAHRQRVQQLLAVRHRVAHRRHGAVALEAHPLAERGQPLPGHLHGGGRSARGGGGVGDDEVDVVLAPVADPADARPEGVVHTAHRIRPDGPAGGRGAAPPVRLQREEHALHVVLRHRTTLARPRGLPGGSRGQPPAIAPTTRNGSSPRSTAAGSGSSSAACDRSSPHA